MARSRLLRWFYEQDAAGDDQPQGHHFAEGGSADFEGTPLTGEEIGLAVLHLCDRKLLDAGVTVAEKRAPITASITADGQDFIEQFGGGVARYLDNRDRPTAQNTTNFGLAHSGILAIHTGSGDLTQNVPNGVDLAALGAFVEKLLRELSALNLNRGTEDGARAALGGTTGVAAGDAPPGRVLSAMGNFAGYLMAAGQPVVAAVLMMAAQRQG